MSATQEAPYTDHVLNLLQQLSELENELNDLWRQSRDVIRERRTCKVRYAYQAKKAELLARVRKRGEIDLYCEWNSFGAIFQNLVMASPSPIELLDVSRQVLFGPLFHPPSFALVFAFQYQILSNSHPSNTKSSPLPPPLNFPISLYPRGRKKKRY